MLKLFDLLKRGEADAVMFVDLDRLGRGDLEEWSYFLKVLKMRNFIADIRENMI